MSDLRRPSDSDHPDDLIAGLVDGTLTAAERADLQAHLDGCERCRAEVAPAERAAKALRGLPELDAPWGLGREAIEEARKGVRGPRSRRLAAVAGVAAAAILLAGLAFSVLRGPMGGDDLSGPASVTAPKEDGGARGGSTESSFAAPGASDEFVIHDRSNYDRSGIEGLASSYAAQLQDSSQEPAAPQPTSPETTGGSTGPVSGPETTGVTGPPSTTGGVRSATADTESVVRCIDKAAGYAYSTRPLHVIVGARFEEKPALIGLFLHGPGAGQPADLLVVWVSSPSPQCSVLHYASRRIAP